MAREPSQRRGHHDAVPDGSFRAPCGITFLDQPPSSDGNRDDDAQPHRDDECAANESVAEGWRMLTEEVADAAEHARPDSRANHVEDRETRKRHRRQTRERRDEHARNRNEPANQDRRTAMSVEKRPSARQDRRTHALRMLIEEIPAPTSQHKRNGCSQRGRHRGHQDDDR